MARQAKPARARKKPGAKIRQLRPGDLDAVVEIDRQSVGRSRRGFFERRLQAVQADPDRYITLGAERDGALVGYAIAHLGHGEFGVRRAVAVVEAIGVATQAQGAGAGRALMEGVRKEARAKGIDALFSQVDWTNRPLMDFFARSGFSLAPRVLLEREIS